MILSNVVISSIQVTILSPRGGRSTRRTSAFVIPALQKIQPNIKKCQALILSSNRDSAGLTSHIVEYFAEFMDIESHLSLGGTSMHEESKDLQKNPPQVIVGTPGRVFSLVQQNHIRADDVNLVIIDEAEEMVSVCTKDHYYCSSWTLSCFALLMTITS